MLETFLRGLKVFSVQAGKQVQPLLSARCFCALLFPLVARIRNE